MEDKTQTHEVPEIKFKVRLFWLVLAEVILTAAFYKFYWESAI